MDFYFENKRLVPPPTKAKNLSRYRRRKMLPPNEMVQQKVTPSEPARKLGTSPQVVNRIVDIKHETKIDTIADAREAPGNCHCVIDAGLAEGGFSDPTQASADTAAR